MEKSSWAQYMGVPGSTMCCVEALVGLLGESRGVSRAWLFSASSDNGCGDHCFLVETRFQDKIFIKSGFTSGYSGTGPTGLSNAIQALLLAEVEVDEFEVDGDFITRVDQCSMTPSDLDKVLERHPVRPKRIYDYIKEEPGFRKDYNFKKIRHIYPMEIPLRIVEERIVDLAIRFRTDQDGALQQAFRRLEGCVRSRTGLKHEVGAKLFSRAFLGDNPPLCWEGLDPAAVIGRAELFKSVFLAYRNRRAHIELDHNDDIAFREFMLVNELFWLESEAIEVL